MTTTFQRLFWEMETPFEPYISFLKHIVSSMYERGPQSELEIFRHTLSSICVLGNSNHLEVEEKVSLPVRKQLLELFLLQFSIRIIWAGFLKIVDMKDICHNFSTAFMLILKCTCILNKRWKIHNGDWYIFKTQVVQLERIAWFKSKQS